MRIPYYQVNAFTSQTFGGNPAGVCILQQWLPDVLLQRIAAENDFAETAFFTREEGFFHLRWFSPTVEIDLCGHATLASAYILFSEFGHVEESLRFQTRSGILTATLRGDLIELDFPSRPTVPCAIPHVLVEALGARPRQVLRSRDYLAVFDSEADVAALNPNFELLHQLETLGIIVTAPGIDADFVSRFFAPRAGVLEDPVTGSAHCSLIPYWAERLGKKQFFARQISKRGGELYCSLNGDRVGIAGRSVIYCRGELDVPNA